MNDELSDRIDELDEAVGKAAAAGDTEAIAHYYHDTVLPKMDALRQAADGLEVLTADKYWPFPTYSELLFY